MQMQTLPGHDGQPPGTGDLLLGDPGSAIGPLLSVTTEVTRAGRKRSAVDSGQLAGRVVLSILGAAFGLMSAGLIADGEGWAVAGAVLGVVVAQLRFLRPPPTTTFVGTDGLARFARTRSGLRAEVLRWDDAGALFVAAERRTMNGTYVGTVFSYTWRGPGRRKLFEIRGAYHDGGGGPPPAQPDNPIHFARAAEQSFTAHLLSRARDALTRGEQVVFDVSDKEHIRLSDSDWTLRPEGRKPTTVPRLALARIGVDGDILILSAHQPPSPAADSRGDDDLYRRAYQADQPLIEHRFRVSEIPNFRLLMTLLEENVAQQGAATGSPPD